MGIMGTLFYAWGQIGDGGSRPMGFWTSRSFMEPSGDLVRGFSH